MNSTDMDFNIFNQCFNTSPVVILIRDVLYMLCMQLYVYKIYILYIRLYICTILGSTYGWQIKIE